VVVGVASGRWKFVRKMVAQSDRIESEDVRGGEEGDGMGVQTVVGLSNKCMQLTAASVTRAAGHPARRPAGDGGRGRS
jgi:hypothetical protein